MIVMGARGHKPDGSGGEIAIYWNESRNPFLLLRPSRFSYWLFNFYVKRWPRK
jgi:hypothetical protein